MSVYSHYTGGEPIGMDHPLFMAGIQSRIDAGMSADAGVPLDEALRAIRDRMQELFGGVPLALVDFNVSAVYAQRAAQKGVL